MQIENLGQLIPYLDALESSFDEISSRFSKKLTKEQLRMQLISNLNNGSDYFGLIEDKKLVYFFAINKFGIVGSQKEACCWLMYIQKQYRDKTKNLINTLFEQLQHLGFEAITFITSNTTPSYNRWISKFARKSLIVYETDLTHAINR